MAVAGSRVAAGRADVLLVVVGGAAAAHAERVRLVAALTERPGTLADLTLQLRRWKKHNQRRSLNNERGEKQREVSLRIFSQLTRTMVAALKRERGRGKP